MDIETALKLTPGTPVYCPADRGQAAYRAKVIHVGTQVCKNSAGSEYIWVNVRRTDGVATAHVWPSNRLSKV